MPLMVVEGKVQGSTRQVGESRPCEWCGVPLNGRPYAKRYEEAGPNAVFFYTHLSYEWEGALITQLCQPCLSAFARLGIDGLRELPDA